MCSCSPKKRTSKECGLLTRARYYCNMTRKHFQTTNHWGTNHRQTYSNEWRVIEPASLSSCSFSHWSNPEPIFFDVRPSASTLARKVTVDDHCRKDDYLQRNYLNSTTTFGAIPILTRGICRLWQMNWKDFVFRILFAPLGCFLCWICRIKGTKYSAI